MKHSFEISKKNGQTETCWLHVAYIQSTLKNIGHGILSITYVYTPISINDLLDPSQVFISTLK